MNKMENKKDAVDFDRMAYDADLVLYPKKPSKEHRGLP